jgi:4-carboxymuconolactone decarboxylase
VTRLPKLPVEALDADQRALYDAITGGPRLASPTPLVDPEGRLEGPFNAMLLHPPLGDALQAVGGALRYRGMLTARAREIAILVVAAHWRSDFEWYAHEPAGRAAGLTEDELSALRSGAVAGAFTGPGDRLVAATTAALLARRDLTDAEFTAAREGLGLPSLFELTTLVGYYTTLALQLRVFRVATPSLDRGGWGGEDPTQGDEIDFR